MDANPWRSARTERSAATKLGGTIRSRVAHALRDRILVGELEAGSRIDIDKVANDLGTSRTPVREACLELAHDRLVRMAPRSGITVIGIKSQDLLENFSIMTTLSGVAADWATLRMNSERLDTIKQARDHVEETVAQRGDIADANWHFHRAINVASDSPRLLTMLAQTGRLIPADFFRLFPDHIPCTLDEHHELVDALGSGDHGRARTAVEKHFENASGLLEGHFGIGG